MSKDINDIGDADGLNTGDTSDLALAIHEISFSYFSILTSFHFFEWLLH